MYSLQHLASFPGNLKETKTLDTLNRINADEGILPHPLLFSLSEDVLIVSDEITKKELESYPFKRVLKCKCVYGGKDFGNIMLMSTRKAKGKVLATHIFKGSDELLEMAVEEINFTRKKLVSITYLRSIAIYNNSIIKKMTKNMLTFLRTKRACRSIISSIGHFKPGTMCRRE